MASVILHAFKQIKETGAIKLFRSHNSQYADGGQLRDFVYVKDLVKVCLFLQEHHSAVPSGIYNVGTGKARSFLDLAHAVFKAVDREPIIYFIDTPIEIREKYQYFTQADMTKLRQIGYAAPFYTLEEGVADYVQNYLKKQEYF